jgi:hypothetical protein
VQRRDLVVHLGGDGEVEHDDLRSAPGDGYPRCA